MIRDEEAGLGQWKTREPAKWNACGKWEHGVKVVRECDRSTIHIIIVTICSV
jgi:hypothetical protein